VLVLFRLKPRSAYKIPPVPALELGKRYDFGCDFANRPRHKSMLFDSAVERKIFKVKKGDKFIQKYSNRAGLNSSR